MAVPSYELLSKLLAEKANMDSMFSFFLINDYEIVGDLGDMNKAEKYLQTWDRIDRKTYISLTRAQLEFVANVSQYPSLVHGANLENGIRRYETFWLPLCYKHGSMTCDDWAAPLDIAWVWYLHMLAPASYKRDCIRLIKNAPNHRSKSGEDLTKALETTERLWTETYKKEPFNIDLTSSPQPPSPWKPLIKFNFHKASVLFMEFYYQVSLPHFRDESFLCEATKRYVRYLDQLRRCPVPGLRPPVDVQLVMQSHQLNPIFYSYQAEVILGLLSDPADLERDDKEIVKIYEVDLESRKFCESEGLAYDRPGSMFRGRPTSLEDCAPVKPSSMATATYTAYIHKVQVSNISPKLAYVVHFEGTDTENFFEKKISTKEEAGHCKHRSGNHRKPSFAASAEDSNVEYMQLKELHFQASSNAYVDLNSTMGFVNPMYPAQNAPMDQEMDEFQSHLYNHTIEDSEDSPMGHIHLGTPHGTAFTIALYEAEDSAFTTKKTLIGSVEMDTLKCLGSDAVNVRESFTLSCLLPESSISFEAVLKLSPMEHGNIVCQISSECKLERFSNLSKAMTCPELTVPPFLYNEMVAPAEVITHPVFDPRGNVAFKCRVIKANTSNSRILGLEVLNKEGIVMATSHLLQENVLPRQHDLQDPTGCVYFAPEEGDNAMVIRGREDWGICIGRRINLPQVDQNRIGFLGLKLFLLCGKNEFCYLRKYKNATYLIEISSGNGEDSFILISLEERRILMSRDIHVMAEAVALFFSVLLLRYLAYEDDRETWVILGDNELDLFGPFQSKDDIGLNWNGKLTRENKDTSYFVSDSWGYVTL